MKDRLSRAAPARERRDASTHPRPELFAAGVLVVVLALSIVKAAHSPLAVGVIGGLAFAAMLAASLAGLMRGRGAPSGTSAALAGGGLAVIWIAAGMMIDPAEIAAWRG